MTKYLIAIKGPDGGVLLREENPYKRDEYYMDWARFEAQDARPYPLHNYTLTPGDRVESDGFELVWQFKIPAIELWRTVEKATYERFKDFEYFERYYNQKDLQCRQIYIPVASKEGEKEERQLPPLIK